MGNTFQPIVTKYSIWKSTVTNEEENFARFGKAIVGIGTNALQEVLETYIPSKDIAIKVTSTSHPNLWGRLNPQQRFLIGQAATDGYKDFDITLCYTLLRNLNVRVYAPFRPPFPKPTHGWGNQPLATDTTQSDDIERIRILRNEMYGHLARPYIQMEQFTDIWRQLKDVFTRMKTNYPNGTDFPKELRTLESCKVTRFQWDSIVELIHQGREHKKAIADNTQRLDTLTVYQSNLDRNLQALDTEQKRHGRKIDDHDKKIDEHDKKIDGHDKKIDENDKKINDYEKRIEDHDMKIDNHDKKIDEHGTKIDEHRTKIDEHSTKIDEHGTKIDEHSTKIDEHGTKIGEHGTKIDEHCTTIDNHATMIVEHGTMIDEHDREIDEHGAKMVIHGTKIDEHSTKIDEQGTTIDNHTTKIVEHSTMIDEHDREIDEHDAKMVEHGTKIDEHCTKIDEHSTKIDEHSTKIDEHSTKIDEHGTKIGEHSTKIDENDKTVDKYGAKIVEHGTLIDEHDREIDEHSTKIDEYGAKIIEHGTLIVEHGTKIDEHGTKIDEHKTKIQKHGTHIDEHSTKIDEHSTKIDEHGTHIDEHSTKIDEHGTKIDEHSTKIDEHGTKIDEHGTKIDEHSTKIDEHGTKIDEHSTKIDEHRTMIDEHGAKIAEHGTIIDEHGTKMDEYGTKIDEHSTKIDEHGTTIDNHATKIVEHGTMIHEHDREIDEHGAKMVEHGTKIDEHKTKINDQDKKIDEHDTRIDEHGTKIDEHGTKIGEHGTKIDYYGTKISEHGTKIVDQGTKIHEHGTKIDGHGLKIDEHGTKFDEHGTKIDEHDTKIDRYGKKIHEHSNDLARLNTGAQTYCVQIEEHGSQLDEYTRHLDSIQAELSDIRERLQVDRGESGTKPDIGDMKQKLLQINNNTTEAIPLSPLQERRGEVLPLELIYASVVIRKDLKCTENVNNFDTSTRTRARSKWESLATFFKKLPGRRSTSQGNSDGEGQEIREVTGPADIFPTCREEAGDVYMLGDAAHGKTTYCLWLVKKWCNAQIENKKLDEWENAIKDFDFVFLLQFRYLSPKRDCLIDMVCKDIFTRDKRCHATIRYILSSDKYRSLIIMDGLDEWKPNERAWKQLTSKGMPNIEGLASTVSCFFSMRPWVFPTISKSIKITDRVLEIRGLSETGLMKVIKNVLVHHFKLTKRSSKYAQTYDKISRHLKEKSVKSFMQIPLLAVVCVQIWYEGNQVGNSMTSFYAAMLNMLVERANKKHAIQREDETSVHSKLPEILSMYLHIEKWILVLLKLGKVAYEGLLSNETNLVFQKAELERQMGLKELQFALDVGLISQKEAHSLVTTNVSVNFFHKSIQEFLAVIYIVTNYEVRDSFCKHLSNVKVIMELSNVILFICGMCPSLGSLISQLVVSVTDSDTDICSYRKSPKSANNTVIELYNLQLSWYRELQSGQTDSPVTFHVSDVYLDRNDSDVETVRVTKEIMSDCRVDIRSLYLNQVRTDKERGISDIELKEFLSNKQSTRSLVMVFIDGDFTDRSVCPCGIPTLRTLYLSSVKMDSNHRDGRSCPPPLTNMTSLRVLQLGGMGLRDRGVCLSADMLHLEKVMLRGVNMFDKQWKQFVLSVQNLQHNLDVELFNVDFDDKSLGKVRSSPDFKVTKNRSAVSLNAIVPTQCNFSFTRVWPPSNAI